LILALSALALGKTLIVPMDDEARRISVLFFGTPTSMENTGASAIWSNSPIPTLAPLTPAESKKKMKCGVQKMKCGVPYPSKKSPSSPDPGIQKRNPDS
jgi:hypothetical protein